MIDILPMFPDDVVAFSLTGEVSEDDYRLVLVPVIDEKLKRYRGVRLFFHLGPQFTGFTAGGTWEDIKLGVSHWSNWDRVAVITDVVWMAMAVRLTRPLFHHPLRLFSNAEFDAAREWISEQEDTARAA